MNLRTKKRIVVCLFLSLILCTVIFTAAAAIESCRYDIENPVDVLSGLDAVFRLMAGGYAVLYEADLFHTVHYFLTGARAPFPTALILLSNLSLILLSACFYLLEAFTELRKYAPPLIPVGLFLLCAALRSLYFCARGRSDTGKRQ